MRRYDLKSGFQRFLTWKKLTFNIQNVIPAANQGSSDFWHEKKTHIWYIKCNPCSKFVVSFLNKDIDKDTQFSQTQSSSLYSLLWLMQQRWSATWVDKFDMIISFQCKPLNSWRQEIILELNNLLSMHDFKELETGKYFSTWQNYQLLNGWGQYEFQSPDKLASIFHISVTQCKTSSNNNFN